MRKYLEISKIYMKTQLAWRADIICNMAFIIVKILFAYLLWGLVFQNKTIVGPFTFHGMLSYYIISSFLAQIEMSSGISWEIHDRIRNGTFSKYMVIPVGIERYFLLMELGVVAFYIIFDWIAAIIWVVIFQIQFTFTENIWVFIGAIVMAVLGLIFMVQLNYFLGILTVKYQGISTFLMIKNNLVELATGSIIPLALFPELVVKIMKLLPFYYVTYLPSMAITGHCEQEVFLGICVIAFWCIGIQFVIHITWKRNIRKYDGVGI